MSDLPIEILPESDALPLELPEPSGSKSVINANTNSVKMNEVVGATFLGLISLVLLFSLLRSQRRNRQLSAELAKRAPRLALLDRPYKRKEKHA